MHSGTATRWLSTAAAYKYLGLIILEAIIEKVAENVSRSRGRLSRRREDSTRSPRASEYLQPQRETLICQTARSDSASREADDPRPTLELLEK